MSSFPKKLLVAARDSPLSRAQVEEIFADEAFLSLGIDFTPIWMKTTGDVDQRSSLSGKEKTDFFTKEIDEAVLACRADVGIHSAKDLPDPIPEGLVVVAYTRGVDPSDMILVRKGDTVSSLPPFSKVGTSSPRRTENLRALRPDLRPVEIRGTIEARLALLDKGAVDALIIAKAALIRLKIQRHGEMLPGPSAPMQGRLAVTAREGDEEMKRLFGRLHADL